MKRLFLTAVFALLSVGVMAQRTTTKRTEIFEKARINAASEFEEFEEDRTGVIHATAGRIIFKKVKFDQRKTYTTAQINLTLASLGDRWDKSGSCFIVPVSGNGETIFDVLNGSSSFPEPVKKESGELKGIVAGGSYSPAIELLRFMTPFGCGFYSDDQFERKPVYIPVWEKEVKWEQDITQLMPTLQGEYYVGIWIDSWTAEGYEVSLSIDFEQTNIKQDKMPKNSIIPVINTVYYGGGQGLPDVFAYQDLEPTITMLKGAKKATLYYITTGHGGHSGGDEFVKVQNYVYADGKEVLSFIPWRDDCASFRRFNPATGVWLVERTAPYIGRDGEYTSKEIEEGLGSSDLSRSNWCPGSQVEPIGVVLDNEFLTEGEHTIKISIPTAAKAEGNKMNHWLVSAYVVVEF